MAGSAIKIEREMHFKIEDVDIENSSKSINELATKIKGIDPNFNGFIERWSIPFTSALFRAHQELIIFDSYAIATRRGIAFGALDLKGASILLGISRGETSVKDTPGEDCTLWLLAKPYDLADQKIDEIHTRFFRKARLQQKYPGGPPRASHKKIAYASSEWWRDELGV